MGLAADPSIDFKRCEVDVTVDQVENMKGKGQYVYAHVASSKSNLPSESEPIFKFNDGHYGGSHDVLHEEHASLADGNVFAGSCLAAIKPHIIQHLSDSTAAAASKKKLVTLGIAVVLLAIAVSAATRRK